MSFALADLAALVTGAGLIKNLISPNQNQPPPLSGQGGLGGQGSTSGWPVPPSQNPPPQVPGTRDQPPPATPPGTGDQVASTGPVVPVPPRTPNAITPAGGNVPVPRGGTPSWMTLPPAQLYATNFGPVESVIMGPESGGKNIRQVVNGQPTGPASGYLQIEDDTWRNYAPQAGVDLNRWPTAMSAPPMVQQAVAQNMPVSRWAKGTYAAVKAAFPWITPDMTLGQIDQIATRAGPQRYIPAQPDRGPGQWGRTPSGGYALGPGNMPTSQSDFGNIMQKAMLMAPLLSLFTRAPSTAMLASYGSFVKGYQQGQLLQQQLSKGQWQENLKETTARLETEAIEAGDAFTALQNDPGALSSVLEGIANKYGDDPMRAALANGGPDAVHKLLQGRDAYYTDLNKAQIAQEKLLRDEKRFELQQETTNLENQIRLKELELHTESDPDKIAKGREELQKLRDDQAAKKAAAAQQERLYPGSTGGGGGEETPDDGGGPSEPPQRPAQAPADTPPDNAPARPAPAPAPSGGGGGGASGGGSALPPRFASPPAQRSDAGPPGGGVQVAEAASDLPDPAAAVLAKRQEEKPAEETEADKEARETGTWQYGRRLLHGMEPPGGMSKVDPAGMAVADYLHQQIAAVGSRGLQGKAMVDAIRSIDAGTADQLQGLLDRKGGVPGSGMTGRNLEWNQFLSQLARQADPTWNPNFNKAQEQFIDPNTATARLIGRANSMVRTGAQVLEYANKLPPDANLVARWADYLKTGWGGSPEYTSLFQAWQSFVIESNALKTGSAGGSVTESEEQARAVMMPPRGMNMIPPTAWQVRDAVKLDTDVADSKLEGLNQQWKLMGTRTNGVLDPMYGLVPEVPEDIKAITGMDSRTGRFSGPVPRRLQRAAPPDTADFDPNAQVTR